MKMQRVLPHSFNSLTSKALVYVDQQLHSNFSCKHENTLKLKEFPSLLNYFFEVFETIIMLQFSGFCMRNLFNLHL